MVLRTAAVFCGKARRAQAVVHAAAGDATGDSDMPGAAAIPVPWFPKVDFTECFPDSIYIQL